MTKKCLIKPGFLIWLLILGLFQFFVVGCSDEPSKAKTPAVIKKNKPPEKKIIAEQPAETTEDVLPRFVYSPTGRRDPFEPLVKKDAKKNVNNIPLTPLQRFDLGQFRLQAVLIGKGDPRAMVSAPDGKTYILSPGIKIGKREGVVTKITRESIQVEEVHYDLTGVASRKLATIDLPEQKSF